MPHCDSPNQLTWHFLTQRKTHTHLVSTAAADSSKGTVGDGMAEKDIPRSLVVRASKVTPTLRLLIKDIRRLMSPYTALNLKERKYDFLPK